MCLHSTDTDGPTLGSFAEYGVRLLRHAWRDVLAACLILAGFTPNIAFRHVSRQCVRPNTHHIGSSRGQSRRHGNGVTFGGSTEVMLPSRCFFPSNTIRHATVFHSLARSLGCQTILRPFIETKLDGQRQRDRHIFSMRFTPRHAGGLWTSSP